jgi:hypothetical protein
MRRPTILVGSPASQSVRTGSVAPVEATAYREKASMLDIVMIALGVGFFAVACLYVSACDRL